MTKSFVSTVLMSTALGVGFFVSTSAGAAGFGGMVTSMLGQPGAENMNVDETLVRMSEKMNRTMPQKVDASTRLDKVSAEPGQRFSYHYTMLDVQGKDVNTANFYKTFRPTLQKKVCGDENLKMFFRNRVTVAYDYQGKDGQEIGKLVFSPKDCGYSG